MSKELNKPDEALYETPGCVVINICTGQVLCASMDSYKEFEFGLDD